MKEGQDKAYDSQMFEVIYVFLYWFIYVLSWVVIPLAQEYEAAGDFTFKERFKKAVKRNVYFYIIFTIVGIAFVIYLTINKKLTGLEYIDIENI